MEPFYFAQLGEIFMCVYKIVIQPKHWLDSKFFNTCPPRFTFEVLPLSLHGSVALVPPFLISPDAVCTPGSRWILAKRLTLELCPSTSLGGEFPTGSWVKGVRVQGRSFSRAHQMSQRRRRPLHKSQCRRDHWNTEQMHPLSPPPPPPPFALQIISSKCAQVGMQQQGSAVWMVCYVPHGPLIAFPVALTQFYSEVHT